MGIPAAGFDANAEMLSDCRVADLSRVLAGPYTARVLAELGAEVIKIESPAGDPARQIGPFRDGESMYFAAVNAGKLGAVMDLQRPEGRRALDRLLSTCDIVVENFLPRTAKKLNVSPAQLRRDHPHLIVLTVSSYNSESERADEPAFDLAVQAESGIMSVTGEPDGPPVRVGVPIGDLAAGMWAAIAGVSALYARTRTGTGRHIEIPLFDASLSMLSYVATAAMATGNEPAPVGSGHHSVVPYGAFPASDGWIAIAAIGDGYWKPICRALDLSGLLLDERLATNEGRLEVRERIESAIGNSTIQRTVRENGMRLSQHGIPNAPVNSVLGALRSPYTEHMGLVQQVGGPGNPSLVANPVTGRGPDLPAPSLGEHTSQIMSSCSPDC